MQIIDESPLLRRSLVFASILPFLVVFCVIVEAKIDFYPINQSISIYDYEVLLLFLLLAPFIYSIPSTSHTALMLARTAYWFGFIAFVMLIMLAMLIMFATRQI